MKKQKTIISLASLALVLIQPIAAHATTDDDLLRARLTAYGVSAEVQSALLNEIHARGYWDSMVPGATAIASQSYQLDGDYGILSTFADGSVIFENVPRAVSPKAKVAGISSCQSTQSGTGYVNYYGCRVFTDSVAVQMAFTADFSILQGSYNDQISSVRNKVVNCYLGTCSSATLTLNKAIETSTSKAHAQESTIYVSSTGLFSNSYSLDLYVGADSYQVIGN